MARRVKANYQIKFDYVAAFYLGERASPYTSSILKEDKFFFIKKHLDFLKAYGGHNIHTAAFLVNSDSLEERRETMSFLEEYFETKPFSRKINEINFEIIFRANTGYSYGAWNEYISANLKIESPTEYFFCIEDDYLPTTDHFVFPFIKKCSAQYPYVCCLIFPDDGDPHVEARHAAISNGLFLRAVCEKIYRKEGSVFQIDNRMHFSPDGLSSAQIRTAWIAGCVSQTNFYYFFTAHGFDMTSIADEYQVPFQKNLTQNRDLTFFGKADSLCLIEPIAK